MLCICLCVCVEVETLADHGIMLPPNMQGLTDEQIEELKLHDEWADKCKPSGGPVFNVDKIGRRTGQGIVVCMGLCLSLAFTYCVLSKLECDLQLKRVQFSVKL